MTLSQTKHLVLDIETMARGPEAVVMAVGYAILDMESGQGEVVQSGYCLLDVEDQLLRGRTLDSETLKWWDDQSLEARMIVFPERFGAIGRETTRLPIEGFSIFLGTLWVSHECELVWGYGAAFDITIVESLLNTFGFAAPWSFRQQACLRTLSHSTDLSLRPKPEIPHHPEHDAVAQAQWLKLMLGAI